MNNIVTNFPQILEFAKSYGLPMNNKRSIVREYLQTKILDGIYKQTVSRNIIFIGGTSLRLLWNLPRFSEDLDFDLNHIPSSEIKKLMDMVLYNLKNENIEVELYHNMTKKRSYYELRFTNLLYQLRLSTSKEEKLAIKFDYETFWRNHSTTTKLIKRYGYVINIVTIPLEQILVQKLYAYIKREQTLARDIYDIVWLYGNEIKPDWQFAKKNRISKNILNQAQKKYEKEKRSIIIQQRRLVPFLFDEREKEKTKLFTQIISADV